MVYLAATIIALVSLAGIALTLAAMPGIWLAIGVALIIHFFWIPLYDPWTLFAVFILGVLAELAEFLASAAGSKKAGGTRHGAIWSVVGAIIGAIVGSPFLPIVGTIIGGVIGAGLGAILGEIVFAETHWKDALRIGRGAAIGRLVSTVIKAGFATVIAMILIVAALV